MVNVQVDAMSRGAVKSSVARMRHWVISHAVTDFYQGLVPASIPFFVLERDYSYLAASGLALAATLGSALPQPVLGVLADRWRMLWLAPAGLAVAGIGAGLAGLAPSYPLVWLLLLVSGLGTAAYHPAAGRDARRDAGGSAAAMSRFAAGGSVGFFLAPALATPVLVGLGVGGTAVFVPPAVLMAFVLWRHQLRRAQQTIAVKTPGGQDRWAMFLVLTAIAVARSVVFLGLNTFLVLYWVDHLGAAPMLGGVALTVFLSGGVLGTLVGGRLADRIGRVNTVRFGCAAVIPALLALYLTPSPVWALLVVAVVGVAVNIPFAVLVALGQDYLPTRLGTAAGVTLGLAVTAGGLFVPLLGLLADRHDTHAVLTTLCVLAVPAVALALLLAAPVTAEDAGDQA